MTGLRTPASRSSLTPGLRRLLACSQGQRKARATSAPSLPTPACQRWEVLKVGVFGPARRAATYSEEDCEWVGRNEV